MIAFPPHIYVKSYGGLCVNENPEFSGSGGGTSGPPKKPKKKAPLKPAPKKK